MLLEAASGPADFEFGVHPFYFLRHGATYETERGILQGQNDTRLTPKGRDSAVKAAEALDSVLLRSIYASSLHRAWQTASILSVLKGVPVFPLPGLMERYWGPYQGFPKEMRSTQPDTKGIETMEEFRTRVMTAMESIRGPSPVLIVAHSGVFRVLCHQIGISTDPAVTVESGLVVKFEPSQGPNHSWHLSIVG